MAIMQKPKINLLPRYSKTYNNFDALALGKFGLRRTIAKNRKSDVALNTFSAK